VRIDPSSHLHLNRDLAWLRAEFCDAVHPTTANVDSEIGNALHSMNCAALAERYGDKEFPRYQFRLEPASPRQVYDAIKNLQYQATEGTIPETALYKLLVQFRAAVADEVIEQSGHQGEIASLLTHDAVDYFVIDNICRHFVRLHFKIRVRVSARRFSYSSTKPSSCMPVARSRA
jgi:hypothetical protein